MDKNRLSLKLLELRQENNLTQKQLCEELNISRANYSYFENGHRIPDIYTLLLISKYYHISLDELVSAENFKSSRKKDQIAQCDSDISITHHLKSKHIPIRHEFSTEK